jgi:hypothetical protein
MRRSHIAAAFVVLLLVLGLAIAGVFSDSVYAKLTNGAQAVGVVIALSVAAATLLADSKDRRLDRVLALHKELTSGETHHARARLVDHLRALGHGGKARTASHVDLIEDSVLAHYASMTDRTPRLDLNIIIRFFERANAARLAKAVHLATFADLVGGHALWWDRAIVDTGSEWGAIRHMRELAAWTQQYAHHVAAADAHMKGWLDHVATDFTDSAPP